MAFMEPDLYNGDYYCIDNTHGETTFVPADVHPNAQTIDDLADYCEGTIASFTTESGYLGRLSASGYMDCTDWTPLDATNDDDALRELCDYLDLCPTCFDQCWGSDEPCKEN